MSDLAQARPREPFLPPLALGICVVCLSILGVLSNLGLLTIIIKQYKRGVIPIIIQVIIADTLLLSTSIWPELWADNNGTWDFGYYGCLSYRGFNAFASSASAYLVVALALHSLALIRRDKNITAQHQQRLSCHEDEEMESSCHSLVAKSDSSTPPRTMNIDYTNTNIQVSVFLPTTFLWILSASLSVPEFVLATTVNLKHDVVQCILFETNAPFQLYWMFAIGNLFLSLFLLIAVGIHLLFQLISQKKTLPPIDSELYYGLKLSLWLISIYIVLCAPRTILHIYNAYRFHNVDYISANNWHQNYIITGLSLGFGLTSIAACLIRPILYISIKPLIHNILTSSKCVSRK